MLRFSSIFVWVACVGCGGSSFDITEEQGAVDSASTTTEGGADTDVPGTDSATVTDSGTMATDSAVAMDTTPPPADTSGPCVTPGMDATDVYVDASVATTGKGAASCPFKTIIEATTLPKSPATVRVIHVKAGTYAETDVVSLWGTTTLRSEGGSSKLSGGSKAACAPTPDKCVVRLEGPSTVDGFIIDASGITLGVVITGGGKVLNSTVSKAARDGVHIVNGGELGPSIHVDDNSVSGVIVRGGLLKVAAGTNSFDRNKGAGTFGTPAGGIVLFNNATLDFGGGSASENQHGVIFDWGTASSTTTQNVNKLIAKNNRVGGLTIPQNQKAVVIRGSVLTKNAQYGLWFSYNSAGNTLDIGNATAAGGNTFGGAADKNGKVGIFLCRSGATSTQAGEGNSWGACPPTQLPAPNCDAYPASYADVGYVPSTTVGTTAGLNPVAATKCTVGP
jgi:hypothetical protein